MTLPWVVVYPPRRAILSHWAGVSFKRVRPDIKGMAFSYPHSPQMWVVRVLTALQSHPSMSDTQVTWAREYSPVGCPGLGVGLQRRKYSHDPY